MVDYNFNVTALLFLLFFAFDFSFSTDEVEVAGGEMGKTEERRKRARLPKPYAS
jgi:hypothetical protein